MRPQPDGGFRIVTVGGDRFRLLDVVVGDDPPYLQAEVEWLAEEEAAEEAAGDPDGIVGRTGRGARLRAGPGRRRRLGRPGLDGACWPAACATLFTRYVAEVAGLSVGRGDAGPGEAVDAETAVLLGAVADDPTALSYLVASAALLTTEDRQALLAESATRRRLAAESRLLRRELTLLTDAGRRARAAARVRRAHDGQLTAQGCGHPGGTSTSGRSGPATAGPAPDDSSSALEDSRGPAEVVAVGGEHRHQVGQQRRERGERQGRRASRGSARVVTTATPRT